MLPIRWPFSRFGRREAPYGAHYGASSYGEKYGSTPYGENAPPDQRRGLFGRLLRWPFRRVRSLMHRVADLLVGLYKFLLLPVRWLGVMRGHRQLRHLLHGLPAVIGLLTICLVAVRLDLQGAVLLEDYDRAALVAFQEQEWETAELMYDRLLLMATDRPRAYFNLGLVLEKQGQVERATAIMRQIAPPDALGFARAHRWLAERLVADAETFRSEEKLESLRHHYEQVCLRFPRDADAFYNLARYYVAKGVVSKVTEKLIDAARLAPQYHFQLGLWHHRINQNKQAVSSFRQADSYYESLVASKPLNYTARLRWASCQTNLGQPREALRILAEGAQLDRDSNYQPAMAHACVHIFDRTSGENFIDHRARLAWLRRALVHVPNFPPALSRLGAYGVGNADEEVQQMFEALLTDGNDVAFLHFVVGIRAWESPGRDEEKSLFHFARAYAIDPEMRNIGNNLAWVLANKEHADLDRALKIIESVLRDDDTNPIHRDTRGQIFVKQQRWNDALDDLEFALQSNQLSGNKQLHQALAQAYDGLDQKSLAAKHRDLAASLPE